MLLLLIGPAVHSGTLACAGDSAPSAPADAMPNDAGDPMLTSASRIERMADKLWGCGVVTSRHRANDDPFWKSPGSPEGFQRTGTIAALNAEGECRAACAIEASCKALNAFHCAGEASELGVCYAACSGAGVVQCGGPQGVTTVPWLRCDGQEQCPNGFDEQGCRETTCATVREVPCRGWCEENE